jgi:uncharacterized protein YutE (UPF0331/DUF86 family)
MVDPDRVRRLLEALADYSRQLADLRDLDLGTYVAQHALAGRYLVQASAQACIDIANHVIASSGWRSPRDFRDAFTVLEENEALEAALAERLRSLAGLRNRLVHLYEEVDDELVHKALPEGLSDLDAYAKAIARLLDGTAGR